MEKSEEHDKRLMAIVSIALRQPPMERQRYLRLACEEDELLCQESAELVKQEENCGDFMKSSPIRNLDHQRPFEIGQLLALDRFEIVREIGEGGMAFVYEAFDRKRNQRIAVKAAKTGFHRLLSSELNGALQVRHWNVCLVNEIHTARTLYGEIDFITMELLEGETLSAKLHIGGNLPEDRALDLAFQLCSGLAAIHEKLLHRDFKSSNILLCPTSNGLRAVITDFGLACGMEESGTRGGTPRYMAPEVWRGEKTSKASDIFALGVVLYEMVTARFPFDNPLDCMTGPPSAPSSCAVTLGAQWDRIILQCLKADPKHRPADALIVLAALKRSPRQKVPWLLLASIFVAILSIPPVRVWLHDATWPPPSVRLAILPLDTSSDPMLTAGVLQDVTERVARLRSGQRTIVVIPPSEVSSNHVKSLQQAKEILHATHALQTVIRREGNEFVANESMVDLNTLTHMQDFSGRYTSGTLGSLPAALTGTVSLALRLKSPPASDTLSTAATVTYDRGLYLLRRDDESFDDAIPLFDQATRMDPRSPLPLAGLAEAQIMKFEVTKNRASLEDARRFLLAAESLSPDSVKVRLIAGLLNQTAGQYEKALQDYRRVQDLDPRNVDVLLHIASIYNNLDMNNEAITTYQRAIELEPEYYKTYRKFGQFYYFRSNYSGAAEQFRKAIDLAPGVVDTYNELASALSDLGRDDEAEKTLLASIHLRETADALNSLGAIRAYQERDAEAVSFYTRAVKLDATEYIYWLNMGDSSRRLGRLKEAADAYRKGMGLAQAEVNQNPHDGYPRAFVGYFSARLGARKVAENEIIQAKQEAPDDTKVTRRAVLTYEALGQRDKTIEILKGAPPDLMRELDRHPDLAELRKDSRFIQIESATKLSSGGK